MAKPFDPEAEWDQYKENSGLGGTDPKVLVCLKCAFLYGMAALGQHLENGATAEQIDQVADAIGDMVTVVADQAREMGARI